MDEESAMEWKKMICYLCNSEIFEWEEFGFTDTKERHPFHKECQDNANMEAEISQ